MPPFPAALTTLLLLALLHLPGVRPTNLKTCYLPNGADANLAFNVTEDYYFAPCNNVANNSMCCAIGPGRNGSLDACLPNGLCYNNYETSYWRESCTDKTWQDPACVKLFVNGSSGSADARLTNCSDGSWCLGVNNTGCCNSKQGIFLDTKTSNTTTSNSTVSTTSRSTSAYPTSTSTSTNSSTLSPSASASPTGLSTGAKIGIGLGIGLGVLTLLLTLAVVCILLRSRSQRRRKRRPPLKNEIDGSHHYSQEPPVGRRKRSHSTTGLVEMEQQQHHHHKAGGAGSGTYAAMINEKPVSGGGLPDSEEARGGTGRASRKLF